ncbi:MAG TPA: homogentisate 1,2-dioxygenase, partial [Azospirillaceae bacterium]|nr:homogentisate 1,2-dioxygenase [Azospirillaceae bacterium]
MSKKNWIPVRGAQGRHSRQAHADLPDGAYEREMSKEGFFGPAAFLYHPRPPTGWSRFEGPLRPRAFDLNRLNQPQTSPWDAPVVLHNSATELRFWKPEGALTDLARNADGDQLLFIHAGAGDLFCDFGRIGYRAGDYLYLPRGTMWRLAPAEATAVLTIQATNTHFTLPDRGLLGPHAIFDPAMLDTPAMDEAFRDHQTLAGEFPVRIKKRGQVSVATYEYNPLDAVGWHGELSPVRLNVKDIRPVVSHRYHLPPSVHTTFLSDRFVVCTFTPRPFETDP